MWASILTAALLFEIEPRDPLTLVMAPVLMMVVGMTPPVGPHGMAADIDPAVVLRDG